MYQKNYFIFCEMDDITSLNHAHSFTITTNQNQNQATSQATYFFTSIVIHRCRLIHKHQEVFHSQVIHISTAKKLSTTTFFYLSTTFIHRVMHISTEPGTYPQELHSKNSYPQLHVHSQFSYPQVHVLSTYPQRYPQLHYRVIHKQLLHAQYFTIT